MKDVARIVTAPGQLSVSCVDSETEFGKLGEVWNELLWESARPVPFLTWEWISTWWRHFRDDSCLFVLVSRDANNKVVGLAPLRIVERRGFGLAPLRCVEFLGYQGSAVCADHLDFLTAKENRKEITDSLAKAIFARCAKWDALVFADLAEHSIVPQALVESQVDAAAALAHGPQQVCPYVHLSDRWEVCLKSMKHKKRWFVKRKRELLEQNHRVRFLNEDSIDDVHRHLDILERLHHLSRLRHGQGGNFRFREYRDFHHAVAERMATAGYLYLARLDCDNQPVASGYGYKVGGVLFYYQTGYDIAYAQRGVGGILLGMIIQDAIERLHATELDFLRGQEEYKYFWTDQERRTHTLLYWGTSLRGKLGKLDSLLRQRLSLSRHQAGHLWNSISALFRKGL